MYIYTAYTYILYTENNVIQLQIYISMHIVYQDIMEPDFAICNKNKTGGSMLWKWK